LAVLFDAILVVPDIFVIQAKHNLARHSTVPVLNGRHFRLQISEYLQQFSTVLHSYLKLKPDSVELHNDDPLTYWLRPQSTYVITLEVIKGPY
jgi:hypothetical protein